LELAKMGFVSLFQSENYGDLHIEAKKPIEEASVSQVENYESAYREEESALKMAVDLFEAFEGAATEVSEATDVVVLNEEQIEASFAHQGEDGLDMDEKAEDPLVKAATDEEILEEEMRLAAESGSPPPRPPEGELF
jgi:hypothetical protein